MTFFECRKSSIVYCWCPVLSCLTLCNSTDCSTPGFPVLHHLPELLKLMFIESGVPSRPLLPSSPPALNLSQHQSLFQWVDSLHQVAKVLELQLQLSISPSSEYSGLSSFKIGRLDLLAVQGTLKSLLQHHSSKASVLQCSALFIVQLSHP